VELQAVLVRRHEPATIMPTRPVSKKQAVMWVAPTAAGWCCRPR